MEFLFLISTKNISVFELYFLRSLRTLKFILFQTTKKILPPSWPFLAFCNATYFGIRNSELFFPVLSGNVSVKIIKLNFSFKRPRRLFNLCIFLFRLLIFKWNIKNVSSLSFSHLTLNLTLKLNSWSFLLWKFISGLLALSLNISVDLF